jgi:AcrR family transcriptional regulator
MYGSETFAIEVSSSSINVASVTVPAITHGFTGRRGAGFRGASARCGEVAFSGSVAIAVAIQDSSEPGNETEWSRLSSDSEGEETDSSFFGYCFGCGEDPVRKGEQTRQKIIAAAAPIFNQHGYEGASMHALMEATGLEKGGIYRHFSSKEELAVEAFRYAVEQAVKVRTSDLDQIQGTIAKLHAIVKRFAEAPSPVPGGCPLMNTAIDSDDGNPVLRELAAAAIRRWRSRLEKIVEQGIQSREIREDAEPRRIATVLIATLEGALMMSRLERSRAALADARHVLDEMIDSLSARKSCP